MTLRQLAEQNGIFVGTAINSGHVSKDVDYAKLAANEFNQITAEYEMKWRALSIKKGEYNFSLADKIMAFAKANNMAIRGHALVWSKSTPEWVNQTEDKNELSKYVVAHIEKVAGRYGDDIFAWDVVNEPFTHKGELEVNHFSKTLGKNYIEDALRVTHHVCPKSKLFINEWGADDINAKSDALYAFAKDLLEKKVPLDGIGFQMHMSLGKIDWMQSVPDYKSVYKNLKRFSDLGLEVHITEMDVLMETIDGSREEKLKKQAEVYKNILETALEISNFKAFTVWGVNDKYSWLGPNSKENDAPVLFDVDNKPKPSYFAVQEVLDN